MICVSTGNFSYGIGDNADNLYFKDLRSDISYLSKTPTKASYITKKDGSVVPAVSAASTPDGYTFGYADGNEAQVTVTLRECYAIITLRSVLREDFLKIAFVNIPLELDYQDYIASDESEEFFTATLMGLTKATRMAEHPGRNILLRAEGYPKIGLRGCRGRCDRPVRAAVFGTRDGDTRDVMKQVMNEIPNGELPKNRLGGPYADDCTEGRGTYITVGSDIRREDVHPLIEKLKRLGVSQISYHQGGGYRQGDFVLIPQIYPNGDSDLHYVMDELHHAGIRVMLHSYTFFLAHDCRYLTPVPHEDLDTICRLTLAENLSSDQTEIRISEAPDAVSEIYDSGIVSSPYLKIGKELIKFGSVRHEKPYAFLTCERGALGTAISEHKAGEEVRQLKEYFKCVLPKADSPLFYEVAQNTADFYNKFGFDGFYMDAIDGVFAFEGNEYAWYYAVEFITEVMNRLEHDPIFDCCYNPQYTGSFYARSRYGALDHGTRALRQFVDAHVYYDSTTAERMFLPPELGWFDYCSPGFTPGWQSRLMREEDVEYLWNRVVAMDACFSLNGGEMGILGKNRMLDRALAVSHRYDEARKQLHLTNAQKRALRTPGNEYSLIYDGDKPNFIPTKTYCLPFDGTHKTLAVTNPFKEQKPTIRLFALTGGESVENGLSLIAGERTLSSHNVWVVGDVNAGDKTAVTFRLCGDASGSVVRLRLRRELVGLPQSQADYFVKVDFEGWRDFTFYETRNENDPYAAFSPYKLYYKVFSDVSEFYTAYRTGNEFERISKVAVDIVGEYKDIRIGDIACVKPRKITYTRPSLTIGGKILVFPCTLESGNAIECTSDGHATVVDPLGNVLCDLGKTDIPLLPEGSSDIAVNPGCDDIQAAFDAVIHIRGTERLL